jgi:hypothetical protein
MILGSPLGGAPKFIFTVRVQLLDVPEPIDFPVALGDSIVIKDDEKDIATVTIVGLYDSKNENKG